MYIIKFLKFYFLSYRILQYHYKIKKYTMKKRKLEDILNLGFVSEQHFNKVMKDRWNSIKPKNVVNIEGKKRLQNLAGIKVTENEMTITDKEF